MSNKGTFDYIGLWEQLNNEKFNFTEFSEIKNKEVALKLKDLGFDEIKYVENLDFTEVDYELDTFYESDFAFLENIEVNSTYLNNPIKYRTNDSHYCMCLGSNGYGDKKEISKYGRKIYLNSLILDPNSIPDEITTESTIGVIKKLAYKKKQNIPISEIL